MSDSPFKIAPPGWQPGQPGQGALSGRGRVELLLMVALVIGFSTAALLTALMAWEVLPLAVSGGRLAMFVLLTPWIFRDTDTGQWAYLAALGAAITLVFVLPDAELGGEPMRWILFAAYGGAAFGLLVSPGIRERRRQQRDALAKRAR